MKAKYIIATIILAVVSFIGTTDKVLAQTPVCPAGYICTPIEPQPPTPVPNNPVPVPDATARVGNGVLELIYDKDRSEASLKATFTVSVNGGTKGVYMYKVGSGYTFVDQKGTRAQANSYSGLEFTPVTIGVDKTSDQHGQILYIIPANRTVLFRAVGSVNPKHLFAGTYYASMISLWINTTKDINDSSNLQLPDNRTNVKTIIGEVSPYIKGLFYKDNQVNFPLEVGYEVTIRGQRFQNSVVNIDGNISMAANISKDGTVATFQLPNILDGQHYVFVDNKITGASNRVGFQVGSTTTNQPSITVLSPNGGEIWQVGKTYEISWRSSNVTKVSLDFYDPKTGNLIVKNLENIVGNPGSIKFTVPSIIKPGQYWLRVGTCLDPNVYCNTSGSIDPISINGVYDGSDYPFTISSSTSPVVGESANFAEKFNLTDITSPVTIGIAADNSYSLHLNGRWVADGKGDYNFSTVNLHNLTPYLVQGTNTLEVKVFNNYLTGTYETGLGNPAGLLYKVVRGDCRIAACVASSTAIIATDGNEVSDGKGAGGSMVLSKNDPMWVTLNGARWIWTNDYYKVITPTSIRQISLATNPSSPISRTVVISNVAPTENVVLAKFDIKSQGQDATLRNLILNLKTSKIVAYSIFTKVKLNINGITYTSNKVTNDTAIFSDLAVELPADQNVTLTVLGDIAKDINNIISGSNASIGLNSNNITAENKIRIKIPVKESSIASNVTAFQVLSSVIISNESAQLETPVTSNDVTVAQMVSFNFSLTASDKTLYISSNPSVALVTSGTGFNPLPAITSVSVTPASVTGDSSAYFMIPAGTTRAFKWSGAIKASDASTPGVVQRMFGVDKINYGRNSLNLREYSVNSGGALKVYPVIGQTLPPTVPSSNPSISSISQNSAAPVTQVVVYGTGFEQYDQVCFDVNEIIKTCINPSSLSSTQLSLTVPSLPAGNYGIRVRRGDAFQSNKISFVITSPTVPPVTPTPPPPTPTPAPVPTNLLSSFSQGTSHPYDTLTTSGTSISSAVETTANGGGTASNRLSLSTAKQYKLTYTLTQNSGVAPNIRFVSTGNGRSYIHLNASGARALDHTVRSGTQTVTFTPPVADGYIEVSVGIGSKTDFSITNVSLVEVGPSAQTNQFMANVYEVMRTIFSR